MRGKGERMADLEDSFATERGGGLLVLDHKLARKKRSQFPLKIPSISPLE